VLLHPEGEKEILAEAALLSLSPVGRISFRAKDRIIP
jgi:hypothetical protein